MSHLPGKIIKLILFYFIQKLSLRVVLASVYREAELLVTTICLLDLSLVGYFVDGSYFNRAKHQLGHLGLYIVPCDTC